MSNDEGIKRARRKKAGAVDTEFFRKDLQNRMFCEPQGRKAQTRRKLPRKK